MYRGTIKQDEEIDNGLKVTYRNMKTGMVEKTDPYILRIVGEERTQLWERPAGSGNLFDRPKDGVAIGRWIYEEKMVKGRKIKTGHYDEKAEHVKWNPPLSDDQKLARSVAEKDAQIEALRKELDGIKAEKAEKEKAPAQQTQKKNQGA